MCKKLSIQQRTKEQGIVFHLGMVWARYGAAKNKKDSRASSVQCFTQDTIKKIIKRVRLGFKSVCLVHDFALQLVPELLAINPEVEITIAYDTSFAGTNSKNLFNYTVYYIKGAFKQFPNIRFVKVEDLPRMNFDLIIANPPYGSAGARITDIIRRDVKYKQYINLLPANDYKRVSNLHQYVRNMEAINNGFADAAVTTHLCEVVKDANNMTLAEFEISQYIDPQLDKYFRENAKRTHYAIDKLMSRFNVNSKYQSNVATSIIFGWRDINHHHLPFTKDCATFKWNVEGSIDADYLYATYKPNSAGVLSFNDVCFNTHIEKTNISNFIYSPIGFKFISKVYVALNQDGAQSSCFIISLPKVDWTRAWTVEEILADYGYTEIEITEVMADLENFKDMER